MQRKQVKVYTFDSEYDLVDRKKSYLVYVWILLFVLAGILYAFNNATSKVENPGKAIHAK